MALDQLDGGTGRRSKMFLAAGRFPSHPTGQGRSKGRKRERNRENISYCGLRKNGENPTCPKTLSPLLLNNIMVII